MKLPEKIYLQVTNKKGMKVKDIIVQLKVRSGTKNPYYIFFPKTNEDGESILSQNDFSGQFEDHFETGLMDYNGSIETANPEVEVSLFDPTWMKQNKKLAMAWPLLKNEKSKWYSREEQYSYMVSCINLKFKLKAVMFNIEESNHIVVNVENKA